jgi:hypothetical protein
MRQIRNAALAMRQTPRPAPKPALMHALEQADAARVVASHDHERRPAI